MALLPQPSRCLFRVEDYDIWCTQLTKSRTDNKQSCPAQQVERSLVGPSRPQDHAFLVLVRRERRISPSLLEQVLRELSEQYCL